jgi:hypothetical protein
MGFISYFAILFFTSKLCTVPLWFLFIFVFYTFQGIQGYLVRKFWPGSLFYNEFTRSALNLKFENLNSNEFDSFDWG